MRRIDRWGVLGLVAAGLLVVVVFAAGCGAGTEGKGGTLEGIRWVLESYPGAGGQVVTVPSGVEAWAKFEGGRVAGSGGCNRYTAAYTLDGAKLTVGAVAGTMMACPPPASDVESAYFQALPKTASYTADDAQLTLFDADGKTLLTYVKGTDVSLTGTAWVMTGYNNGKGGLQSGLAGVEVTALFGEDGSLSGSAGCNNYTGTFTSEDKKVTISPLASTKRMCVDPPGIMEQEAAYLAALPKSATYSITGDTMELRDADGAMTATYKAAVK